MWCVVCDVPYVYSRMSEANGLRSNSFAAAGKAEPFGCGGFYRSRFVNAEQLGDPRAHGVGGADRSWGLRR